MTTLSPSSRSFFDIRNTSYGGRGAFATQAIPAGSLLLTSPSPAAHVVFRLFRRECCAECFAYDCGRTWKFQACAGAAYFCTELCRTQWIARSGDVGVHAWTVFEEWLKRAKPTPEEEGDPPDTETIERAWMQAEDVVSRPRGGVAHLSKLSIDPDVLGYLLSGVLTAHNDPALFAHAMNLAPTPKPYRSPGALRWHTSVYIILCTLLSRELRTSGALTAANLRSLAAVDAHNSFGAWSIPEDDGSEMLGFGVYPEASFFNHSCAPLVVKERVGRAWCFRTARDIKEGEELTISYLGQDELREWNVQKRRDALYHAWEFVCGCPRCTVEGGEAMQV